MDNRINLQDLPDIVLEKIFSYLTYNQIAENRIISRKFNEFGKEALNRGYNMVEKFHRKSLKAVRSKLPRRESERKIHPLARQCDILVAIETRLSMLSMTFLKYIECKQCCFIPGKVIDELLRVIKYVNKSIHPPRPHDLLQELRDITSMAMEHFEERIVPILKEKMNAYKPSITSSFLGNHLRVACNMPSTSITCNDLCSALKRNQASSKVNRRLINLLLVEAKRSRKKEVANKKQLKLTLEVVHKQKREIIRLKRVIQNWEAKFRDLSAEVRTISTHPFKRQGDSLENENMCVFVDTFDDNDDDNMASPRKAKKPRK
ncbi:F-box only protein 28 isoform X2 [Nilaparvata lugens]|uniref:F-box only protein 28 isoform X2 n=1 Tax=Nilaparvata lugens TaxID=108931 RepID=UPI000B98FF49|nr:F-box only protein 28 isoform X2 [Nilaparvata lugens]